MKKFTFIILALVFVISIITISTSEKVKAAGPIGDKCKTMGSTYEYCVIDWADPDNPQADCTSELTGICGLNNAN